MKRVLCLLLTAAIFVCCMPLNEKAPDTVLPVSEIVLESENRPATTAIAANEPSESPALEPAEAPQTQHPYVGTTSEAQTEPIELPITIKEIDWEKLCAGKQYETKFYNETVNFQNLRMTVISFASGESGTQFTLRLDLPDEWTDLQCLSMNPCFGFRFYLDEKSQNDFRLVDQFPIMSEALAVSRCNSVTMTYRSDTVTDTVMHAAHEWKIVPFFCFRKMFGGSNYNDHPGGQLDLEQDEVVRFNGAEKAYYPGTIGVTELPALSVQLPIEHTEDMSEAACEPKMLQVTIWTEDVERNKAAGHYGADGRLKGGEFVVYGTYRNETVDFSELEFHIERFYYWEHGFFYTLHIVYPESWSEEVIKNVRLCIEAYADGEPYGEQVRNGRVSRPYFKSTSGWLSMGDDDSRLTEQYLVHDQKNFSLSDPIPKQKLTFKVWLEYFPKIRFDNSDKEIDLTTGEPYYIETNHEYVCDALIPLTEFSISTDALSFSQGGAQ